MIDEPSDPVIKPVGFWRRAWRAFLAFHNGFKTFLTALILVLSGILDQYQLIDLLGTLKALFGDTARIGLILAGVAALFILLRVFTKTPIFGLSKKSKTDDGD